MSILPTSGIVVSAAGLPLAQSSGPETARAQQAATVQQRHLDSEIRAAETAGIARTDGDDQETHDRDADGRRPWEFGDSVEIAATEDAEPETAPDARHQEDPPAESGSRLDLTG